MKRKSKILAITASILLITLLFYGYMSLPRRITNIAPSEVISIDIFDGNTGKHVLITDKNDIRHIIENLNGIKAERDGISFGRMGFSFRTTIYKSGNKVYKQFIINSENTIRKDPFFYRDNANSIDYKYIQNLIKNQGS